MASHPWFFHIFPIYQVTATATVNGVCDGNWAGACMLCVHHLGVSFDHRLRRGTSRTVSAFLGSLFEVAKSDLL